MTVTTSPFVRLTILGQGRGAHLVLPTDQPSALLMPQILQLLGSAGDGAVGRHELTTLTGELIDQNLPLTETGLTDGDVLRLSRTGEEAATPWVLDMTTTTEAARVPGRWSPSVQRWTATAVAALSVLVGLALVVGNTSEPGLGWLGASATLLLFAMVPAALGEAGRPAAWGLWAVGIVAIAGFGLTLPFEPLPSAICAWALAVLASYSAGLCADRIPVATSVAIVLTVITATALVCSQTIDETALAAGVTATVALLLFGVLPRVALALSGTFRLDQRVTGGAEVSQVDAGATVAAAHWAVGTCAVVLAVGFGTSGWLLGRLGSDDPWTALLLAALTVAVVLRARHFPLGFERFAMWSATLPGLAGAAAYGATELDEAAYLVGAPFLLAGVIIGLLALVRTSDYTGAQLRRAGTRLETFAVLATIPLIIGGLGLYDQLLDTF